MPVEPLPVSARWRDFAPRFVSAIVLAPLVLAAIWQGGVIWQLMLCALGVIAMAEWMSVCGMQTGDTLFWAALAGIPAAWAATVLTGSGDAAFLLPVGVALLMTRAGQFQPAGVLFIGWGYAALLVLRQSPGGRGDVLFIMLVVWATDVGAYLAGRLIGGPRIAPRLSPGKTWAGSGGGMLAGIAMALAIAAWFGAGPGILLRAGFFAGVMSVAGQLGDLAESGLKRNFGVKDSGHLIPGHGGLLDRVDALMAAAPVAMLLRITSHGVQMWQ